VEDLPTLKVICPLVDFQVSRPLRDAEMTDEEWEAYLRGLDVELLFGVDLSDGVVLRRFLKDDFEGLNVPFLTSPLSMVSSAEFALEKRVMVQDESEFETIWFDVEKVLRNAVLALRLLKEGCFSADSVFGFLVVLADKNKLKYWTWFGGRKSCGRQLTYSFSFEEIPAMNRLLKKIQSVDFEKSQSLSFACKKFQRALEQHGLKDQIVDLLSALETLFKNGGEPNNMAAKIAVECSQLLGKNDEKKQEIRNVLDEAHRIRNKMVSGSRCMRAEDLDYASDVISRTRDYLRLAIKCILQGSRCLDPSQATGKSQGSNVQSLPILH
jgi:hypothetical protein